MSKIINVGHNIEWPYPRWEGKCLDMNIGAMRLRTYTCVRNNRGELLLKLVSVYNSQDIFKRLKRVR